MGLGSVQLVDKLLQLLNGAHLLPVTLDGGQVAQVVGLQSKEPALRLEVGVLHGLAKITGQEVAVLLLAIPNLRVLLNVDKGVLVVVEVRLNAVKLDLDRQLLQHAHQVDDESVPGQQLFITGKLHAAVIIIYNQIDHSNLILGVVSFSATISILTLKDFFGCRQMLFCMNYC